MTAQQNNSYEGKAIGRVTSFNLDNNKSVERDVNHGNHAVSCKVIMLATAIIYCD